MYGYKSTTRGTTRSAILYFYIVTCVDEVTTVNLDPTHTGCQQGVPAVEERLCIG